MSKQARVSAEEKVETVPRCLKGEYGIQEAERSAGVDKATIRRWISRYEAEGTAAFQPHEHNRVYCVELKQQAVVEYLSAIGSLLETGKSIR